MKQFIILLLFVSSITASFLEIIPQNSVNEGDKVTIRCTEIFAFGLQPSAKLMLQQNSSDMTQIATWQLLEDKFDYNYRWRLPRTVNRSVDMADTLYTLVYEFKAGLKHNKMEVRCLSSRTNQYRSPKIVFFVKKKPNVLSCIVNPNQLKKFQRITFRCWINLGNPQSKDFKVKGRGMTSTKARREYQTNTKYNYQIAKYSWDITPNRYDEALVFQFVLTNYLGTTTKSFRVEPKTKKKKTVVVKKTVVKDPTAKLELEPDRSVNLHVQDVIRCRVINSTIKWNVKFLIKFEGVNKSSIPFGTNESKYEIPKKAEGQYMNFGCIATAESRDDLKSEEFAKWIFPKNHRSFLTLDGDGSAFITGSTAAATCHFLPRSGKFPLMNVSIVSRENEVMMKATYNGSFTDLVINKLGNRSARPLCTNRMNLFVCFFKLMNIVSGDRGTKLRCETQTVRRLDLLERQIEVQMPPEIGLLTPSQIIGDENDNVTATCLIRLGYPRATKRSLKFDNMNAITSAKSDPVIQDSSGFEWEVKRITKTLKFADQGSKLTCSATNAIAPASAVAMIILNMPVYNVTITPSENATLERNQSFTCTAYGYPLPVIMLTGGMPNTPFIATSGNIQKYYRSVTSTTTIYPEDTFDVKCVARNTINGRDHTETKIVGYTGTRWPDVERGKLQLKVQPTKSTTTSSTTSSTTTTTTTTTTKIPYERTSLKLQTQTGN